MNAGFAMMMFRAAFEWHALSLTQASERMDAFYAEVFAC
jgi:hypothetical protein